MTNSMKEALDAAKKAQDESFDGISHDCFHKGWQAATAAADAKYLPVIERLVEALIMSEAIEGVYLGADGEKNKQAQIRGFKRKRKKALALANPLLGKKEEV